MTVVRFLFCALSGIGISFIGESYQIIHAGVIEVSQYDHLSCSDATSPFFIITIRLTAYAQQFSNLFLTQALLNPQIPYSWIHPSHPAIVLLNTIDDTTEQVCNVRHSTNKYCTGRAIKLFRVF